MPLALATLIVGLLTVSNVIANKKLDNILHFWIVVC